MTTVIAEDIEKQEWVLGPSNRCDSCGAEALVKVVGMNGDLMFCGHHYNKIMDNPEGYKKMMSFMISVIDERDKLIKNNSNRKELDEKE